jgi:hypothetical protein
MDVSFVVLDMEDFFLHSCSISRVLDPLEFLKTMGEEGSIKSFVLLQQDRYSIRMLHKLFTASFSFFDEKENLRPGGITKIKAV